ncbi:ATP-dependent nuclease [Streptomyces ochraceiscleroticus]|uniref:ATP-dependent endonuclease n=1 Tax=Streptomyces ochraceiscleroticus TaxID=47761 RepID=A0ABW1MGA9_9ACTN|nr:TOPRIM nucleotidyl transferase/hydrolase domain-containing protein [Streptomyces ochraceiscleroticus]
MQIISFSVAGFRSLEDVADIPVKRPTILVGPNDGGKSASLTALSFLLGKYAPEEDDLTLLASTAGLNESKATVRRAAEITVTGNFECSEVEVAELEIPKHLTIRRRYRPGTGVDLEMRMRVCAEARLRQLDKLSINELKELAKTFETKSDGPASAKASWKVPLERLALDFDTVEEWVTVPNKIAQRLPALLIFRGDDAPDPESAIKDALAIRFKEYAADEEITSTLNEVSAKISSRLSEDAQGIRDHIAERCQVRNVTIEPQINIRPTLAHPKLRLEDAWGNSVALGSSGAGRARRVSLAVWESSSGLLKESKHSEEVDQESFTHTDVVVIYDEPDTHLDYNHQRRVMSLVREQCSFPNVRIMMATHSLNLIDGVDIGDIVQVESDGSTKCRVVVETPDDVIERKLVTDLAVALGFRNSVLLHERFFVGVEGVTEQQAFPVLFRTYAGRSLQSAGISLWPCGNNEGALNFASFLRANNRAVAFVVDNDSTINRKDLFHEDRLKRFGLDPTEHCQYIGNPMEFEDIFDDATWCTAADTLWPRDDGEPWNKVEVGALRDGKKFSDKLCTFFAEHSSKAARGKAEMMFGLASWISEPTEIPLQLRQVFDYLIEKSDALSLQMEEASGTSEPAENAERAVPSS